MSYDNQMLLDDQLFCQTSDQNFHLSKKPTLQNFLDKNFSSQGHLP
jgi:hypothetical protein